MQITAERRGSIAGSITGTLAGGIKLSTSRYAGKLRQSFSQFLSSTSHRTRRASISSVAGTAFDDTDANAITEDTETGLSHLSQDEPEFSKSWIPIAKAGAGGQVDVYFVIGRTWLRSDSFKHLSGLNKSKQPGSPFKLATNLSLPSLSSGICVVKIPKHLHRTIVDRNCTKLQGLSDVSDLNILRDFGKDSKYTPYLVDWDRTNKYDLPQWTVQEAFNCGTLYEFGHVWSALNRKPLASPSAIADTPLKTWPEALIWHIFIELALALHYIHCAGVAHCDLVAFNICMHMAPSQPHVLSNMQQPVPRFPRLVPIDFGRARVEQAMASPFCTWDIVRLGDLLHEIVHGLPFSAASKSAPAIAGATAAPAPKRDPTQRDPVTGRCSCGLDASTAEKRLSPRGQIVYREAMRYTAPVPLSQMHTIGGDTTSRSASDTACAIVADKMKRRKTMDDILVKLVPQARKARTESYGLLIQNAGTDGGELVKLEGLLDAMVRRKFPGEELIWSKLRAAAKD